ncbi:MAG: META domain-containing protein, partial [Bacteroides sp.]
MNKLFLSMCIACVAFAMSSCRSTKEAVSLSSIN